MFVMQKKSIGAFGKEKISSSAVTESSLLERGEMEGEVGLVPPPSIWEVSGGYFEVQAVASNI